jgi:type IV secretory pathway TrbF-like protein
MIFPLLALLIMLGGALGITWMITQSRARPSLTDTDEEARQLRQAVQDLQLDMEAVRTELAEVYERLDFTERLLTRGTGASAPRGLTSGGEGPPPAPE